MRFWACFIVKMPHALAPDNDFFGRIAQIALRLKSGAEAGEVAAALADARQMFDADSAAFASFVRDDESCESYRYIVACDPAWCLEYESRAFFMVDPWLAYVRQHAEPTLASRIPAGTGVEKAVVALAERFGFRSAIVVPAQAPQGLTRLGALCLGSFTAGYFEGCDLPRVTFAAAGLAARLHEWQIESLRNELLNRVSLTEGELELLRHERDGRKSKQIAKLTGSTWQSVDSRWQRLNAKFGVTSRSAASRIAAEYGLI
jgi:DNA-binding CsgD family transcriptional regulator